MGKPKRQNVAAVKKLVARRRDETSLKNVLATKTDFETTLPTDIILKEILPRLKVQDSVDGNQLCEGSVLATKLLFALGRSARKETRALSIKVYQQCCFLHIFNNNNKFHTLVASVLNSHSGTHGISDIKFKLKLDQPSLQVSGLMTTGYKEPNHPIVWYPNTTRKFKLCRAPQSTFRKNGWRYKHKIVN